MPDLPTFVLVFVVPVLLIVVAIKAVKLAVRLAVIGGIAAVLYFLLAPWLERFL
jgi:hypothetical protein